jgi:pSer/pThr/pTyr-binding forkhead associated (FHA) protein
VAIGWKRKRQVPEMRILSLNARGDEAREFRVLRREMAVGSGEDNQFVIRRPSVSRHHASLVFKTDHYEIADLGSTNGTFVNGQRVRGPAILGIGDELRIGDAAFILANPMGSGILRSAGKQSVPKKILTSRGAFEVVLLAFAIGFATAQYLAYLLYHEQNRLILAEAVAVNQPGMAPVSRATPNHLAGPETPLKTETAPAATPKVIARATAPTPSKAFNSETIAAKELAGGVALAQLITRSGTEAGHSAPDFTLPELDGSDVTLGTMHGKIVLLNFWATWCGACRSEMPSLEKLYQNLRSNRDFALLTISIDQQGKPAVAQFMSTGGYDFPVLLDTSNITSTAYGVSGIPSTFVIGRDGQIIWNCVGALDWSNPTIREALGKLL